MRAWAYLNVEDPMIAWLVYRGEVFSALTDRTGAISVFMAGRLRGAVVKGSRLFATEQAIEIRRLATFPEEASRLKGFFAFNSPEDASRAAENWDGNFKPENLAELEVSDNSLVSVRDSEWITHEMAQGPGPWIDSYLANAPHGSSPVPELVIEGSAFIHNTELRDRAGDIVKTVWPESLPPLELGRIGCLLGFPIGRMSAVLAMRKNGELFVDYELHFDGNNPLFIEKLEAARADPNFPVNEAALQPIDEEIFFKVPDMTPQSFLVAKPLVLGGAEESTSSDEPG